MKAFGLTDTGLKRSVNQDAFYIDADRQLYIVADGMGGHKAGDLASRISLESIKEYFEIEYIEDINTDDILEETLISEAEEHCRKAIQYANSIVYEKAKSSPEYHGMGTTIVMLKILHGHAIIAHVGDSRVYRIQDEEINQLTKDHSRIQELIDQEKISAEEAERYPLKNVITRALGGAPDVDVDTVVAPLGRSDVFVLCTDGLSGVLSDADILELISSNPGDPEESCNRLIQSTLDRGAPDNVTVIVSDTRAYDGGEPDHPPTEPSPPDNDSKGAFRKFIDRWFKGN
ncbi:Stp1/IreP family PP2C-type Ser/Thr phosphatase [bacterium]|nr:Stp1/IreP family PP2C-type Ser/Thr phosphatase [candidate division CSSED10-310 bacterium]